MEAAAALTLPPPSWVDDWEQMPSQTRGLPACAPQSAVAVARLTAPSDGHMARLLLTSFFVLPSVGSGLGGRQASSFLYTVPTPVALCSSLSNVFRAVPADTKAFFPSVLRWCSSSSFCSGTCTNVTINQVITRAQQCNTQPTYPPNYAIFLIRIRHILRRRGKVPC